MTNTVTTTLLTQLQAAIAPIVAAATNIAANPTLANAQQQVGTLVVDAAPTLIDDGVEAGANLVLALDNLIKAHLATATAAASAPTVAPAA